MEEFQKTGIYITVAGVIFLFLGMILLFDPALLSIGNVCFCVGIPITMGTERARNLVITHPIQSAASAAGLLLVVAGYGFFGFIIELCGLLSLFGPFAAVIIRTMSSLPGIGPAIAWASAKVGGKRILDD